MDKRYEELFTAAWRVSVDAKEKVRGGAAELFGKDAVWLRSFDFQNPVKDYHHIRGFRFMNEKGARKMYILRHNGELLSLPKVADERFINAMMSELALAKDCPDKTCEWYDVEKAMQDAAKLNREPDSNGRNKITEVCPGFFFIHYDDLSASLVNSSNQRLQTPMSDYDFILDFKYAGEYDGKEHFAYEARWAPALGWTSGREPIYGLFDVNGKTVHFPHINEYENRDNLVDAVCKSFQKMVREQEQRQRQQQESWQEQQQKQGTVREREQQLEQERHQIAAKECQSETKGLRM